MEVHVASAEAREAKPAEKDVNEVRLVGRVSGSPEERTLPSGDVLLTFRLVVRRDEGSRRPRQTVDVLDCAVWSGRVRRTAGRWQPDDLVEVRGAVRRRFFRSTTGGAASRVEVEVSSGRLIRRAATA